MLLVIALVGIFGLFTIHHEVSMSQRSSFSHSDIPTMANVASTKNATDPEQGKLVLQGGDDPTCINLTIDQFDPKAIYYLDSGDGIKKKIASPNLLLKYQDNGVFLVKLLKNNILIDAIEISIPSDEIYAAKIVSF